MPTERSLIFVHGTGVRSTSYLATLEIVRHRMAEIRPDWTVHGCLWGDPYGAKLHLNGASIPRYSSSGGGRQAHDEVDRWAVLYVDPLYELRLLGLLPLPLADLTPGQSPPRRVFLDRVRGYIPSSDTQAAFGRYGLIDPLLAAVDLIAHAPEIDAAAGTADLNAFGHRHAFARAVLAMVLGPVDVPITGDVRDGLLAHLDSDLRGQSRALPRAVSMFLSPPQSALTSWATDRRGKIVDRTAAMIGDILRYQADGDPIRQLIKRTVDDTPADQVSILAHSLGGVASVDLLAFEPMDRVERLITVGSQAPFFYEQGALVSRRYPAPLPSHFPPWLNIYDHRDWLSFVGEPVFPGHVTDREVSNHQPFPQSHSAYWANDSVWERIGSWLP
ncbi:hypothetical protein [Dactylosporangium sp. CS-033363]|uniref:hypothetical protein n=1 Tax=Dactylosporangium sp. CS-033363 TaxID=3239935 RepID=UPI003D8B05FE